MCLYCVELCFHGVWAGINATGQITTALFSMNGIIASAIQT